MAVNAFGQGPVRLIRGLAALGAVLALLTGALILRAPSQLFTTPLTEDSFYSLAVARNLAAGIGITVDGRQPTNGFQPLFTFAEAGAYWLAGGDQTLAVRLVFGLSWILYLGTAWLVGRIAADAVPDGGAPRSARFWLAALLYGGGFLTFMHHFNGLETGCVMFLYALAWRACQLGILERRGGPIWFGLLLGLLVLARIDAAIFVAVVAAWQLVQHGRRDPVKAFWRAAAIGGTALLISAPWWGYNYVDFGSLMPTSGTAQQAWGLSERRIRWIFWALGVSSLPTLWFGRFDEMFHDGILPSTLRAVVGLGLALLILHAWRHRPNHAADDPALADRADAPSDEALLRARRTRAFAGALVTALAVLAIYYGLSFIAYWFYYRYLFPIALPATVAIACWAAPLALRRPVLAGCVMAALCAPTAISAVMAQHGRTLHVDTVYWEQLALIDAQVPKDDLVAAGQAGTLGYFRPHVVNVDGKVNREAIPYQDRMWDYLAARDVRWFADWPFYVEKYLGADPAAHGWRQVGQKGYWQLWHYEPASGQPGAG